MRLGLRWWHHPVTHNRRLQTWTVMIVWSCVTVQHCSVQNQHLHDFRLSLWSRWELRTSGFNAGSSGSSIQTFRDNLSVPSSRGRHLKMGPIGCPKTMIRNYNYSLHISPEDSSSLLNNDTFIHNIQSVSCLHISYVNTSHAYCPGSSQSQVS